MQKLIEQRLKELRAEFESGQKMMADLESKQINLRDAMLRISGAIQVLEELSAAKSSVGKELELASQSPERLNDEETKI
jgi:hypothetical protein